MGKQCKTNEQEEHIAILAEPGSNYIDHITHDTGKARDIGKDKDKERAKRDFSSLSLSETDSIDSLHGIGCDGSATNIGRMAELYVFWNFPSIALCNG